MDYNVTVSDASPSTCRDDGLDVDVTVYFFDGTKASGEVTLVKDHEGEWWSWGATAYHWVSGELLDKLVDKLIADFPPRDFDAILREIALKASESCKDYEMNRPV